MVGDGRENRQVFAHTLLHGALLAHESQATAGFGLFLALIAFGAIFCLIYPLAIVWPSGWAWHEGNPASNSYFMMIVGVYATLGIFLIRAAKNPAAHASLIGFTVLGLRRPNVFGTVVGAVFVGVLLNGLTMLNAPYYTQDFVKGAVLVGALAMTYGLGRARS